MGSRCNLLYFFVKDFAGTLIHKTPYQENYWLTKDQVFNTNKFSPYDDLELNERMEAKTLTIRENIDFAEGF